MLLLAFNEKVGAPYGSKIVNSATDNKLELWNVSSRSTTSNSCTLDAAMQNEE